MSQFGDFAGNVGPGGVSTHKHHGAACPGQQLRGLGDGFQVGIFRAAVLGSHGLHILRHIHAGHIHRQVDVRSAHPAIPFGIFEGQTDDFRDALRTHDQLGALGNGLKELGQVKILMAGDVHPFRGHLTGDGHQRRAIGVRIRHAGDQIGCAGAEGCQTYACLAGQPAVYIRHEGCALLMPRGNEPDGRRRQRLDYLQVFLTGNAKDDLHPFCCKAFHQLLGNIHANFLLTKEG